MFHHQFRRRLNRHGEELRTARRICSGRGLHERRFSEFRRRFVRYYRWRRDRLGGDLDAQQPGDLIDLTMAMRELARGEWDAVGGKMIEGCLIGKSGIERVVPDSGAAIMIGGIPPAGNRPGRPSRRRRASGSNKSARLGRRRPSNLNRLDERGRASLIEPLRARLAAVATADRQRCLGRRAREEW